MTPRQLLGQHLIVGLAGKTLSADEKKFLIKENIGGVILFARNVESPQQIFELCREIQDLRSQTASASPFFISVDQEGGRVARMREPFTVWPPLRKIGEIDSPTASFNFTMALAQELKTVGVNLDYAPCLDVYTNPKNVVIGDRSLSSDPEMVAKHASALVRGFVKAGVIPCGKHFPGHGNTLIDSHADLPVENADRARLDAVELVPFKKAFKSGLDLVMTAHIKFPKIDPDWPATLSEIFLKKILREELRYRGLVMTDDMDMKAMANHFDRAVLPVRALQAGVDILLYCNDPASPPRALDDLEKAVASGSLKLADIRSSYDRIQAFKSLHLPEPLTGPPVVNPWQSPDKHRALAQALREGKLPVDMVMP